MADPRVKAFFDAQRAQIGASEGKAQFIATVQQERQKRIQKAKEKAQQRALTVNQAAQKARVEEEQEEQELISSLAQPVPVAPDEKGLGQSVAQEAAKGTSSLEVVRGGPQPAANLPVSGDFLGIKGDPRGRRGLGTDIFRREGGGVAAHTREQARTGVRGVDLLNALVGAATGSPFLTTERTTERPDLALVEAQQARLNAQENRLLGKQQFDQQRAIFDEMQEERKELRFTLQGMIDRGVPQPMVAARAFQRGDDDTVNQLVDQNTKRQLQLAKIKNEGALFDQRLARTAESRQRTKLLAEQTQNAHLEGKALELEAQQPLDRLLGVPLAQDLSPANILGDLDKAFDEKGNPLDSHHLQIQNAEKLAMRNGEFLVFGDTAGFVRRLASKVTFGGFRLANAPKKAQSIPMDEVAKHIRAHLKDESNPEPIEFLTGIGLYTKDDDGDMVPVYLSDPFHINADSSRGAENLGFLLEGLDDESFDRFMAPIRQRLGRTPATAAK